MGSIQTVPSGDVIARTQLSIESADVLLACLFLHDLFLYAWQMADKLTMTFCLQDWPVRVIDAERMCAGESGDCLLRRGTHYRRESPGSQPAQPTQVISGLLQTDAILTRSAENEEQATVPSQGSADQVDLASVLSLRGDLDAMQCAGAKPGLRLFVRFEK